MGTFPFVLIGIFIGLILVGILAVFVWKKNKEGKAKGIGYHVLFIMGIIFLPLGIIYEIVFFASDTKVFLILGIAFVGMGLSYLAISLGNRDKCKSNRME
jgi:uncharacterized membrane protein HdeD (DUF308 family)